MLGLEQSGLRGARGVRDWGGAGEAEKEARCRVESGKKGGTWEGLWLRYDMAVFNDWDGLEGLYAALAEEAEKGGGRSAFDKEVDDAFMAWARSVKSAEPGEVEATATELVSRLEVASANDVNVSRSMHLS